MDGACLYYGMGIYIEISSKIYAHVKQSSFANILYSNKIDSAILVVMAQIWFCLKPIAYGQWKRDINKLSCIISYVAIIY